MFPLRVLLQTTQPIFNYKFARPAWFGVLVDVEMLKKLKLVVLKNVTKWVKNRYFPRKGFLELAQNKSMVINEYFIQS